MSVRHHHLELTSNSSQVLWFLSFLWTFVSFCFVLLCFQCLCDLQKKVFFFGEKVVTMLVMLLCYWLLLLHYQCQIAFNALLLPYPYYLIVSLLLFFLVLLPCLALCLLPCRQPCLATPYHTLMSFNFLLFRANINSLAFIFDTFKKVIAHNP